MVMEVLRFDIVHTVLFNDTSGSFMNTALLTRKGPDADFVDFNNPSVIGYQRTMVDNGGIPASQWLHDMPLEQTLGDGSGHGILVATDQIFLHVAFSGIVNSAANQVQGRILYRWKDVSLEEYIGIVQSQQ
jgi:hypothetical protein